MFLKVQYFRIGNKKHCKRFYQKKKERIQRKNTAYL